MEIYCLVERGEGELYILHGLRCGLKNKFVCYVSGDMARTYDDDDENRLTRKEHGKLMLLSGRRLVRCRRCQVGQSSGLLDRCGLGLLLLAGFGGLGGRR